MNFKVVFSSAPPEVDSAPDVAEVAIDP